MQFVQSNPKGYRRLRWQRFWPTLWLTFIAIAQMLLADAVIGLEIWSMILNIKYSFFFIGFIASFFFTLTWISTFIVVCCCQKSPGCATYVLIQHILSIAASSVLIFYDTLFLREPQTCLWPNNLCNDDQATLSVFSITLGTSIDINGIKFTLIKIQIACAAAMILTCIIYIVIFVYTTIRVHQNNKVVDPHTTIELGRIQSPPPPLWPEAPRELPPSSEF